MDTYAIEKPPIEGVVTLYFSRPWVPNLWVRSKLWIASIALGLPTHVTPVVNGTAFVVAPDLSFTVDARIYEFKLRDSGGLYDTLTVPVPDLKGAADAAWTYAVGPMTTWQAFRHWVTGHEERDDIDCVLAAVKVLRGGGFDVPSFRTPKGLYLWLKAKTDSAS